LIPHNLGAIWITLPCSSLKFSLLYILPALIQPNQLRFLIYLISTFSFLLISFNSLSRVICYDSRAIFSHLGHSMCLIALEKLFISLNLNLLWLSTASHIQG
ncbi:uncharacterized protein C8R40DRAFT_1089292, partial [Lentinula edodes]|uniref:uncharacterized protein n=1 Tax=Lentinula edodes TaxID=5353 RepID=UPI001E8D2880